MATPPARTPGVNQTAIAIAGSFVLAVVLATVMTGNPLRAMSMAYTDYTGTPASGDVGKASTTRAPESATPPANRPSATDIKTNG